MKSPVSLPRIPAALLLLLVFGAGPAAAQSELRGRVLDQQTGEPLAGVNVTVAGTTTGTTTDLEGRFLLPLPTPDAVLQLSYVGYVRKTVRIDDANGFLNILLEPDNILLNEVQVVGFDTNRKLQETAGSVAVLTEKDFDRTSRVSLKPVLNTIPGVRVDQSNLANTRISIRGAGIRSNFGIRNLKVYVNEIPITEADGFTRIEGLDVATLGRVEVIKGPASSLYGAGTGGVLHFQIQRSPYRENSLEATALGGSYDLSRLASTYRIGTDRFNAAVTVGTQHYGGYRAHSTDERRFFTGSLQYFPSEKQAVTVLLNQTRQETLIPGALTADQLAEDPRQASASNVAQQAGRFQTWTRIGVSQTYDFNEHLSNTTSVYASFYELDHPLAFAYLRQPYQSYGGRTRMVFKPALPVLPTTLTAGAEVIKAFVAARRFQNQGGREGTLLLNQELDNLQYTLFIQAEVQLTPRTFATLGASLNKVEYTVRDFLEPAQNGTKTFDSEVTPRLAVAHVFGDALALHAGISAGFSPPTTSEISDADGHLRDDVQAERGVNYEIGARGSLLGRRLHYDVTAFSFQMRDQLIPQSVGQNRTIFNNAGKTSLNGLEVALSFPVPLPPRAFFTTLRPFLSYTYSDFTFEDFRLLDAGGNVLADFSGNALTGIAPHVVSAGLDVTTAAGFYLHATYFFNDDAPLNDDNTAFNPAYSVVDVKAGYAGSLGRLLDVNAFVGVDNLFDVLYTSQAALNARAFGNGQPAFFDPAPGRSVYTGLSVKYHFNR
ncbi:TonB-dependent receptor [Rhodocaloribacter litoris]|uniref:TonB-dependent receptor n=1 Tax=Rhodocaloribacter litoris TaxID=2558931 RepID=UPI00142088B3|nr:TonB-dependent receptor [Rhodocaloribacter litoris]QXD15064.1 TonB-dependent receptor [Rhodocaloribacter litoris]